MDHEQLNDELLEECDPPMTEEPPKRNSKQALIDKILELAEGGIKLEYSNTKLKRMNKQQLNELLAETVETAMRNEMAKQVGAKPGATDSVIALGALRMIHDIAAAGTEKTINIFLPEYGYEVEGFADSLKEPSETGGCLPRGDRAGN